MKTKTPSMYAVGDHALFGLFDTGEVDHVCELVRDLHDQALASSLRKLLLVPIDQFIDRLHSTGRGVCAEEYPAATMFRKKVDEVATLCEGGLLDVDAATKLANDLESSWLRFIARAGAHRMYDDLPRDLGQAHERKLNGEKGTKIAKEKAAKARAKLKAQIQKDIDANKKIVPKNYFAVGTKKRGGPKKSLVYEVLEEMKRHE